MSNESNGFKYPTPEMIDAALTAFDLPHTEKYYNRMRAALIAADCAAWRPIGEAPINEKTLVWWIRKGFTFVEVGEGAITPSTMTRPLPLGPEESNS